MSFPDAQILQQQFLASPSLRQLIFRLDGAYLNSSNQKGQLGKGYLKIYDWHQVNCAQLLITVIINSS